MRKIFLLIVLLITISGYSQKIVAELSQDVGKQPSDRNYTIITRIFLYKIYNGEKIKIGIEYCDIKFSTPENLLETKKITLENGRRAKLIVEQKLLGYNQFLEDQD